MKLHGVIAGSVMAVVVAIVIAVAWVMIRARMKRKMDAHGKVVEIELEERER